eukprot:Nk52_evm3s578 gene=Nk52_evmTU3s578
MTFTSAHLTMKKKRKKKKKKRTLPHKLPAPFSSSLPPSSNLLITRTLLLLLLLIPLPATAQQPPVLYGVGSGQSFEQRSLVNVRLFGSQLTATTEVGFTLDPSNCVDVINSVGAVTDVASDQTTLLTPALIQTPGRYYICLRDSSVASTAVFVHQGGESESYKQVIVFEEGEELMPLWVKVLIIIVLLFLSGLFSGLNIGLMSLDTNGLQIIMKSGTITQRAYAKTIYPLRKRGNFLLCTILLGNVLVNNTLTILLDSIISGVFAVLGATAAIVVFGEIVPQSICTRHGLAVGARTVWVTKFFMVLTFPISYPLGTLLNRILGDELGTVYQRAELKELFQVTAKDINLKEGEINILSGALDFSSKRVDMVMTKAADVHMIDQRSAFNFELAKRIVESGFSRFPVYEGSRGNIVGILHVKDLSFIDPANNIPIVSILSFFRRVVHKVFVDTPLDQMMEEFRRGHCHMAIVQSINSEGDGDPFYQFEGIVTLEDLIEEIIQNEILDEFDVFTDNVNKTRINGREGQRPSFIDLTTVMEESRKKVKLPRQLASAALAFLSDMDPFALPFIHRSVLSKLIDSSLIETILSPPDENDDNDGKDHDDAKSSTSGLPLADSLNWVYQKGKPASAFILILKGAVEVQVGCEEFILEQGPFSYFGLQTLTCLSPSVLLQRGVSQTTVDMYTKLPCRPAQCNVQSEGSGNGAEYVYCPDFNVKVVTDTQYLKITQESYVTALLSSELETRKGKYLEHQANINRGESSHSGLATFEIGVSDRRMSEDVEMVTISCEEAPPMFDIEEDT